MLIGGWNARKGRRGELSLEAKRSDYLDKILDLEKKGLELEKMLLCMSCSEALDTSAERK